MFSHKYYITWLPPPSSSLSFPSSQRIVHDLELNTSVLLVLFFFFLDNPKTTHILHMLLLCLEIKYIEIEQYDPAHSFHLLSYSDESRQHYYLCSNSIAMCKRAQTVANSPIWVCVCAFCLSFRRRRRCCLMYVCVFFSCLLFLLQL